MCAINVTGTKKLELKLLPPCLVFHLKRFPKVGTKCSDAVHFPMVLDMTSLLEPSSIALYDCVAFCCHSGKNSTSGHYTACASRGAAGWFRYDDSSRPIHIENVTKSDRKHNTVLHKQLQSDIENAYLLFYVRR
jgi:ubiquitin C-terminal hydrolase